MLVLLHVHACNLLYSLNNDFWGSYDGKWTYYNADGTIKEVKEF